MVPRCESHDSSVIARGNEWDMKDKKLCTFHLEGAGGIAAVRLRLRAERLEDSCALSMQRTLVLLTCPAASSARRGSGGDAEPRPVCWQLGLGEEAPS